MTIRRVFAALAGKIRRMTAGLRDKPDLKIEDYVLEHFLLYNGLVGSTPDNQREYKDVRNEIVQAINDLSAHQLAIALKLPPLWWEDRLEKIFAEFAAVNRDAAIKCLSAARPLDDITGDTTCLSHSNWQVRSNAARMLAFLEAKEAIPRLLEILDECENEHKAAFCHIAYSLAKLGSDQARQGLTTHLRNDEPWFCVDAAGSLAHWNLSFVCADLMQAMLSGNIMDDYLAVAISRRHRATEIVESKDEDIQEGAAELVLSLIKGLKGAFHAESHLRQQLEEVQEPINRLALEAPTPRRLAAAVTLNSFMEDESLTGINKQKNYIHDLSDRKHYDAIKQALEKPSMDTPAGIGQLKHAMALTAQFKLTEMSPLLIPHLRSDFPLLPELMSCLGALGDVGAAQKIVAIVVDKVDMGKRCSISFLLTRYWKKTRRCPTLIGRR